MKLKLEEIAEHVCGRLTHGSGASEAQGYSIDTRTIEEGDLFFAIRGPRFDGHDYLRAAGERGAVAAVVASDFVVSDLELPCIQVDSPTRALGMLAREVRKRWGRLVIGVTGSVGKTTTKEMIASLLEARFSVLRTRGNLNNDLGLPLSLLRVQDTHDVMVLEMGMSGPGEIRHLAEIALPNEGVVTNVNPVHLEFFDSVDQIATAKAELVQGLVGGPRGKKKVFLNADDSRVRAMGDRFDGEVVMFGASPEASFRVRNVEDLGLEGTAFTLSHDNRSVDFKCPLPGTHNVSNAAAAIALAVEHGVAWESVSKLVRDFSTTGLRGVVRRYEAGFVVVDDSYNSNPAALKEMIRLVAALPDFERRILVAGEMLELGDSSGALHAECGRVAREAGIDLIVGVGAGARELLQGAEAAGATSDALIFVDSADAAGELLAGKLRGGDVVLLKASRSVGLDQVSEILNRRFAPVEC